MSQIVYTALGLMSGTSLDGVDAAFLETDGERILRFGPSMTLEYTANDRETLTQATQAALRWQFKEARPNSFAAAEEVINRTHVEAIMAIGAAHLDWMERLNLIGFHGQTVLHHPPAGGKAGQTLQLGDGRVLAAAFGVPVAHDFRSDDVAAGGQGAPLAPIYHKALAAHSGLEGAVGVLNIGGVSNVTLISGEDILATDCGPGNGPLDNWMKTAASQNYDDRGRHAQWGQPDFRLIDRWLGRDFFSQLVPKSADRYDFDVNADLSGKSARDGAATLAAFCAIATAKTMCTMPLRPKTVIVCGGGRRNWALLWMLMGQIPACVKTAEDVGWDGDAIEAQAFAYLAARALRGLPISFPDTTGVTAPMTGGRIAYPSINRGSR